MRRRQVLLSVPAALGLAGCPSGSNRSGSTGTAGPERTGTPTPEPTATATTKSPSAGSERPDVALRSAYRRRFYADAFRVETPDRDQFAFVRPPAEATGSPVDAFELDVGGRRFDPDRTLSAPPLMPDIEGLYGEDGARGWIGFDVPTVEANEGALVVDGDRYPVPDERLPDFASVAEFEVESVSVPDSVRSGEPIEMAVEVRNVGDRAGVFLAGFQHSGLPKLLTVVLDAGRRTRLVSSYEAYVDSGAMSIAFRHPGASRDYEVSVAPSETATPDGT